MIGFGSLTKAFNVLKAMSNSAKITNLKTPLQNLDEWEDFLKERYPQPGSNAPFQATNPNKAREEFRNCHKDPEVRVNNRSRVQHHPTADSKKSNQHNQKTAGKLRLPPREQ